jgi:hypothetical protein
MNIPEWLAVAAVVVLALLMIFQLLLAAGLPLGRAAWGGQHRVLPANLRLGSLAAVVILGAAAWAILARVDLLPPGADSLVVRVVTWVFAAYLALNTVGNLASKSPVERGVMTPVSAFLVVCFVVASLA